MPNSFSVHDRNSKGAPKVLVVGCGSIGTRHVRNLQNLGVKEISVADNNEERLSAVTTAYGVKGYQSINEALETSPPKAVLVCTPPTQHLEHALVSVRSGAHVFVEKPISNSLDGIELLAREMEANGSVIQVGYNWRFSRSLLKVKSIVDGGAIGRVLWARAEQGQYLPDWRPSEDYRRSYSANRVVGGGIILDSSHEIDYLMWILGDVKHVFCETDTLSDLDVDVEDTASITLRFVTGCIGEIHVDFVQRARVRGCKIVGTEGTVVWDFESNLVQLYTESSDAWEKYDVEADLNEMYVDEMKSFLRVLEGKESPLVDLSEAVRVLRIALAAKESAESGGIVQVPI